MHTLDAQARQRHGPAPWFIRQNASKVQPLPSCGDQLVPRKVPAQSCRRLPLAPPIAARLCHLSSDTCFNIEVVRELVLTAVERAPHSSCLRSARGARISEDRLLHASLLSRQAHKRGAKRVRRGRGNRRNACRGYRGALGTSRCVPAKLFGQTHLDMRVLTASINDMHLSSSTSRYPHIRFAVHTYMERYICHLRVLTASINDIHLTRESMCPTPHGSVALAPRHPASAGTRRAHSPKRRHAAASGHAAAADIQARMSGPPMRSAPHSTAAGSACDSENGRFGAPRKPAQLTLFGHAVRRCVYARR